MYPIQDSVAEKKCKNYIYLIIAHGEIVGKYFVRFYREGSLCDFSDLRDTPKLIDEMIPYKFAKSFYHIFI